MRTGHRRPLSARIARIGEQAATVVVTGTLDRSTRHVLQTVLSNLIPSGIVHVLIEATELDFCDVSGARVLEEAHALLYAAGGALTMTPSPPVARMLELLWPRHERAFPNVVTLPAVAPVRHLPTMRTLGVKRGRASAKKESAITPARPPIDTAAAIERSRRLHHHAETLTVIACEQVRRSCQALAALHDAFVITHHVQADTSPLRPCTATHPAKAEAFRARADHVVA
ncbi:STAS domain-containing protein [Nonomuraea typhae]|uniref:STAS domain-containing protein n=1 Tax=Nonomuraea typhae TaxID=2603600 RepID=UPI0012FAFED9|nr:STAS domain-containing protein [Nonomuraea typhae]